MKSIVMKNHYPNPCGGLREVEVSDEVYELLMQFHREWLKIKRQDRRHGVCRYEEGTSEWAMGKHLSSTEDIVIQRERDATLHACFQKHLTRAQHRRLCAYVYMGYNFTEIARMERVARWTVSQSVYIAMQKIKDNL